MGKQREHLLEALMDHIATNGLGDSSMRDLATAVGSSHRMINYHFGGREGLIAAIVERMEQNQRDLLGTLAVDVSGPAELVRAQWRVLTDPSVTPFVRLFFEVVALALAGQPGTEGFLERLTDPWIEAGESAATHIRAGSDAVDIRLGIALSRGLLLDALASGDAGPPTAALERYLEMWTSFTGGK